MTEPRI